MWSATENCASPHEDLELGCSMIYTGFDFPYKWEALNHVCNGNVVGFAKRGQRRVTMAMLNLLN